MTSYDVYELLNNNKCIFLIFYFTDRYFAVQQWETKKTAVIGSSITIATGGGANTELNSHWNQCYTHFLPVPVLLDYGS